MHWRNYKSNQPEEFIFEYLSLVLVVGLQLKNQRYLALCACVFPPHSHVALLSRVSHFSLEQWLAAAVKGTMVFSFTAQRAQHDLFIYVR